MNNYILITVSGVISVVFQNTLHLLQTTWNSFNLEKYVKKEKCYTLSHGSHIILLYYIILLYCAAFPFVLSSP